MPLGGGFWTVQNKRVSGTYVNFESNPKNTLIYADRGFAAIALPLDWNKESEIITITAGQFATKTEEILGYAWTDDAMRPFREIFMGANVLQVYNLNSGGVKATATIGTTSPVTATAKYPGTAGNKLAVGIEKSIDDESTYIVKVYFDNFVMETKTVKSVAEFESEFVELSGTFSSDTVSLKTNLADGTTGTVQVSAHADFLKKAESKYFNAIAYAGTDNTIKSLYESFGKRMISTVGFYVQTILFDKAADAFSITNLTSKALNTDNEAAMIYWLLGQEAGVELGKSIDAIPYKGEYMPETVKDTTEAEKAIVEGKLVFTETDGEIKVLEDINSYVSFTKELNEDYALNEVVRIVFQRAKDMVVLFNKWYKSKERNSVEGRERLWDDFDHHASTVLQNELKVITDYTKKDTVVSKGQQPGGVVIEDNIIPVVTMKKLYLKIKIQV